MVVVLAAAMGQPVADVAAQDRQADADDEPVSYIHLVPSSRATSAGSLSTAA